jgi:hypothetical protein
MLPYPFAIPPKSHSSGQQILLQTGFIMLHVTNRMTYTSREFLWWSFRNHKWDDTVWKNLQAMSESSCGA